MKNSGSKPHIVNSISELHRIFSLPKPEHPLISVIDLKETRSIDANKDELGLPTVRNLAARLHVSPNYLSDMLRSQTGQNVRHYIHDKLIEKAKELISTTSLSVSEIAFQLGFEHPQSFHKLFKNKTKLSPLEFRQSFN